MKKVMVIIGLFIVVMGVVAIFLGKSEILAFPSVSNEEENLLLSTNSQAIQSFPTIPDAFSMPPMYSSFNALTILDPSQENQEFTIDLFLVFPDGEFSDLQLDQDQFTLGSDELIQEGTVSTTEVSMFAIPGLMTGNNIENRHYYELRITSNADFQYRYFWEVKSLIIVPIGIFLSVVGFLTLILGVVLGGKGPKRRASKVPLQPAYEPTIGGGSRRESEKSSKSGRSSKRRKINKGKAKKPTKAKSTAATCRSCNGAMPRNAQYCPHCYARQ